VTASISISSSPFPTSRLKAAKLITDPLVVSVAASIFAAGFWAICGSALFSFSPLVAIGLGGSYLICLGMYVAQHRKEIIYEISLLFSITLNTLYPNTYHWWNKIDEGLYLGAIPLEKHAGALPQELQGPLAILSLVEPFELEDRYHLTTVVAHTEWQRRGILIKHLHAVDFAAVSQDHLDQAVQFIYEMRKQGRTVYVHCKAGVGRSATAIAAYLLQHGLSSGQKFASAEAVIQFIKTKRAYVVIHRNPARNAIHEFCQRINRKI